MDTQLSRSMRDIYFGVCIGVILTIGTLFAAGAFALDIEKFKCNLKKDIRDARCRVAPMDPVCKMHNDEEAR